MVKFKREMAQSTKDKISAKLRGRKLTDQHKQNISNSLKNAWSQVPQTTTSNLWSDDENNEDNTGNE
ncbi:MAG: hypothetical protein II304_04355 [Bacteroidales bacterium]|nr:hypothetical protein [Bacteroidales bacterium]